MSYLLGVISGFTAIKKTENLKAYSFDIYVINKTCSLRCLCFRNMVASNDYFNYLF